MIPQLLTATEQVPTQTNWFMQNWQSNLFTLFTVLLSGIISLVISAAYYRKGNRDNLKMSVVYPMLEILQEKKYTGENNDKLHKIKDNYCVRYFTKSERAVFNNLFSEYQVAVGYHKHWIQSRSVFLYMVDVIKKEKGLDEDKGGWFRVENGEKKYLDLGWSLLSNWHVTAFLIMKKIDTDVPSFDDYYYLGKKNPDGTPDNRMSCDRVVDIVKEAFYAEKKTINIDDIVFFSNGIKDVAAEVRHNTHHNPKKPTVKEVANNREVLDKEYEEHCGDADKMREEFLKLKVVRETIEMFPQFAVLINKKDTVNI